MNIKIGLLREEKQPHDMRVAFLPEQCNNILSEYPNVRFVVQPGYHRCVSDAEYTAAGIEINEDLSNCNYLFGIKEVPKDKLIANKTYLFFSHTIKRQPYNRKMMQAMVKNGITLIDYECITDQNGNRTVAFGYYAGLVGAYNGVRAYGLKTKRFNLKPAVECQHLAIMINEFEKVNLEPNLRIVVTGAGRVGQGIKFLLESLNILEVSPNAFLTENFNAPVYTVLRSKDYYKTKDGSTWNNEYFHKNPASVDSDFLKFTKVADVFMAGAFWHPASPRLFDFDDMRQPDFKIKVIADVTCDIDGSVPSTIRSTKISEPFYDFNADTLTVEPAFTGKGVTVMAVDNLPCELPRDASESFGTQLIANLLPSLLGNSDPSIVERAKILDHGKLTLPFSYLEDYAYEPVNT